MIERPFRFGSRHAWSLTFAALSVLAFMHLASEITEGELDPFDSAMVIWFAIGEGPMIALCCHSHGQGHSARSAQSAARRDRI
jgi:hypothetical protein